MADVEPETESGMTEEEQQQMSLSFGIAKSLLGDLKVSDDELKDSLWHYWFDAEKAVNWLKAQQVKKTKGTFYIPLSLFFFFPVLLAGVEAKRRSDGLRRYPDLRTDLPLRERPRAPRPDTNNALTALQRLSISRQSAEPAQAQVQAKPMSKLAQLAAARKANAASPASSPAPSLKRPAEDVPAGKPLSKLQQKMAAAKAARLANPPPLAKTAEPETNPVEPTTPPEAITIDEPSSPPPPQSTSNLFTPPKTHQRPSTFFSLLAVSKPRSRPSPVPVSLALAIGAPDAFKGPSPDDVVLSKRKPGSIQA